MEAIFSHSFSLSEVYRLSLALTHIFNTHLTVEEALERFADWIVDVRKTKLTCFNTFIKTLNTFKQEIANYFIERQTSGFVEGLNNKIKVLKWRCCGIFNLKHLFQRLHLDVSGYRLYASNNRNMMLVYSGVGLERIVFCKFAPAFRAVIGIRRSNSCIEKR